ncbi:MAG: M48 family metalloprotease [Ilumatobacteraceae bacterium]
MFELIRANKRRSAALIVAFVLVLTLVGMAFGFLIGNGIVGTVIALVVSGGIAFASYWKADAIALAASRAHPADPQQYQRLHNLVEGLCIASGLPKPRVYIIDDPAPNAFATGRDPKHAAIAVTSGLLEKMNRVELEGVVARAVAHQELRHPRQHAGRHAGGRSGPAQQPGHPDDVVERRARAARWRPLRRRQSAGAHRLRVPHPVADVAARPRAAVSRRRRHWPTSAPAR